MGTPRAPKVRSFPQKSFENEFSQRLHTYAAWWDVARVRSACVAWKTSHATCHVVRLRSAHGFWCAVCRTFFAAMPSGWCTVACEDSKMATATRRSTLDAVRCGAVRCSAMQCNAMRIDASRHSVQLAHLPRCAEVGGDAELWAKREHEPKRCGGTCRSGPSGAARAPAGRRSADNAQHCSVRSAARTPQRASSSTQRATFHSACKEQHAACDRQQATDMRPTCDARQGFKMRRFAHATLARADQALTTGRSAKAHLDDAAAMTMSAASARPTPPPAATRSEPGRGR